MSDTEVELIFATTEPAWRQKAKDAITTESAKRPSIAVRVLEGVK